MTLSERSVSDGEIVEAPHKANTASIRHGEPGIDNSNRGSGRNILADMKGYNYRNRSRSPSPYRRKPDRSPSPYRRGRSRSPSPYRRDRAGHGREGKSAHIHKRKASPPRHSRPEKRHFTDRNGDHGRRDATLDSGRSGPPVSTVSESRHDTKHHGRVSYADIEQVPEIPSLIQKKPEPDGTRRTHDRQRSRLNVPGRAETVDIAHRGKDATTDSTSATEHQAEPEYTTLTTPQTDDISEEAREAKRRRWAARRAQLNAQAAESPSLLQHALANASEVGTPASPGRALERSVSPASSAFGSPRLPDMDSVPASPDVMVIDKGDGVDNGVSPPAEESSAANYDPTQDMLDDRMRAEQKVQQSGMSASAYDETNPRMLSTLPAVKSEPAKKKTKKKELDMFALSDDEDEASEEEEEDEEQLQLAKGTVLDEKLLDNWDDADGYYKIISNELVNASRYRMIRGLGRGVFANVAEAEDVSSPGQLVAIKMVRRNEAMKKSSQKEMEFLQRLNEADPQDKRYIIRLLGSFDHKGHLCIVFEHMLKNLRDLLKEDTSGHGLSLQAVKTYSRQMFSGLKHLQDCQIIHADLKPDNILVSHDRKTIKICDLGTAADKRDNSEPTPYLVSRFYRAPEIILGMEIGYGIDMWAIGCTIYELWTGKILFPGRSNNQMIKVMMECLGWPTERLLKKGTLSLEHFEPGPPLTFFSKETDQHTSKPILRKMTPPRTTNRPLKNRVQEAGRDTSQTDLNDLSDLLAACLNWNFEKRIQPRDAINHKFFVKPTLAPRAAVKPTVVKPGLVKRGFAPRK